MGKNTILSSKNKISKKILAIILAVLMVSMLLCGCGQAEEKQLDGDSATLENAEVTHYMTIEIENYGTIQAELYGKNVPITVENFVSLAESGFYNGTCCN